MIKIEEYQLTGYKNIGIANLKLSNFNVIIGPNNSGKSNFIQSISFLNHLINSSSDEVDEGFKRGFLSTHFGQPAPMREVMRAYDNQASGTINFKLKISNSETSRWVWYELSLGWNSTRYNTTFEIVDESLEVKESNKPGRATSVFSRKGQNVNYGTQFSTKSSILDSVPSSYSVLRLLKLIVPDSEEYHDAILCLNTALKAPIFYFSNTELLKTDNKSRLNVFHGRTVAFNLQDEILNLEKEGKDWDIFKSALKNILNIDDVHVFRFENSDKENVTKGKVMEFLNFSHLGDFKMLNQLSDGSILIIAIICKILSSDEQIIFIEEPENSSHPKALVDLLAFLRSFSESKQFIITSHSIALLNKTPIDDVIVSCINTDGYTELLNVADKGDLKKRLKYGHINFSDELFFGNIDEDEFETN